MYMLASHMFDGCTNLTSITFPEDSILNYVDDHVFANCPKLTSIVLPKSINTFEYIDPEFLAGSNINKVTFKGLSDDVFVDVIQKTVDAKYEVGKMYENNYDVMKNGHDMNIPVFAYYTNLKGCSYCQEIHKAIFNTSAFKNWMANQTYYFAVFDEDCQTFGAKVQNLFKLNFG